MAGLTAWLLAVAAMAQPAPGAAIAFAGCPIARDTGPDTDLCFVAEHEGKLYGLRNPADWGEPQLNHRVLVEGRVVAGPAVCGATPFEGRASVLREVDGACNTILPDDGTVPGARGGIFERGPPEARARARELAARAEKEPALSVQPVSPDPPTAPPPQPPFVEKRLEVIFPFDSDRGSGPDMLALVELVRYAQASKGKVEIVGWQAVSRLGDGQAMAEQPGTAKRRAEKMAALMTGLGLPAGQVKARWIDQAQDKAQAGDAWRLRRTDITVTP